MAGGTDQGENAGRLEGQFAIRKPIQRRVHGEEDFTDQRKILTGESLLMSVD